MSGTFTTERINTAEALAALTPDWWALWRRSSTATPFNAPAWLVPWWRCFAPGTLATVAVRQNGRLVGLAPLWLEGGALGLRLLPLGLGISDLFDLLLDPDVPEAGAWLLRAIDGDPRWAALELEELPGDAAALSLPRLADRADDVLPQGVRPVLDLTAGVPAAKRRKLRMSRHRVDRRGGMVEVVGPSEAGGLLADLARLHGARWAARGEPGVLADPAVLRFHAMAMPELAAAGLLRLLQLRIDRRVAGAYYGLQHGDRAFAYLGGFDPDFAFESPGTVLLGHAVEAAADEGAATFDFLRGREAYKYDWGALDQTNHRRTIRR